MLQEEARESWGLRSLDAIARDTRHASAPGFEVYRRAASLASAAAERPWDVNVLASSAAQRTRVGQVSPSYFTMLGVEAARGRTLQDGDDTPGGERVVVVSAGFWRSELGARDLAGLTIELDGARYTVAGVMPPSCRDPLWPDARAWVPLVLTPAELDPAHFLDENLDLVARLRPGSSLRQVRGEFTRIAANLRHVYPARLTADWGVSVQSLNEQARARL